MIVGFGWGAMLTDDRFRALLFSRASGIMVLFPKAAGVDRERKLHVIWLNMKSIISSI